MLRIAIFTSTRADYGLLRWLFAAMTDREELEPGWLVTGSHLEPAFGRTVEEIEANGGAIWARLELPGLGGDSRDICEAISHVVSGMGKACDTLAPDGLVILGDRFEALGAALAAYTLGIPVIHIHGGELSLGAIDDGFRHAIAKLAALHFTAAEPYRRRVVQMGEPPERVFTTGALINDAIAAISKLDRTAFEQEAGFGLGALTFLVTFHPETGGERNPLDDARTIAAAMGAFPAAMIIWTYANADAGGRAINDYLETLGRSQPRFIIRRSLGQRFYVNAMRLCDLVIGNSSSGIIEAPLVPVPSVNIGERQAMRLRSPSVVDCAMEQEAIVRAIGQGLSADHAAAMRGGGDSPYRAEAVGRRMAALLAEHLPRLKRRKPFHDLPSREAEDV